MVFYHCNICNHDCMGMQLFKKHVSSKNHQQLLNSQNNFLLDYYDVFFFQQIFHHHVRRFLSYLVHQKYLWTNQAWYLYLINKL